ncbi:MAG: hypothetical protein JWN03_4101 [Nocardia sp.]|uniref:hypothetical protein n=1 Tax=Nocardia sp. TaxID=1821 RepID=UPI002618DFCD|nr:hypothetical protein [Nocardia sp.]MCU1643826.1 hypothetical protein [Nocardia sp.]
MRAQVTNCEFFASTLLACALTVIPVLGTTSAAAALGSSLAGETRDSGSHGGHDNNRSREGGGRSSRAPQAAAIDGRRVADQGLPQYDGSTDNRRVGDRDVDSGDTEGRRVADRDDLPTGPPLINGHSDKHLCRPFVAYCPEF